MKINYIIIMIKKKKKDNLKTISLIIPSNKKNKLILKDTTFTSKNIYNCCIFTNNIITIFTPLHI